MNRRSHLFAVLLAAAAAAGCENRDMRQLETRAERTVEQLVPAVEDAAITGKVKAALIAAPEVSGTAIDVDTQGQVVSLQGTVEAARQRAEEIARKIEGVRDVRNSVVVKR